MTDRISARSRLALFLWSACALIVSLSGCTRKSQTLADLPLSETLRVHLEAEPPTLDWNRATDMTSRVILLNLMETLIGFNFKGDEIQLVPQLATKWKSDPSLKRWTIDLRKNVRWSDGQAFVAQQVVDSFERFLNPKTGALNTFPFYVIKGAREYNKGEWSDFDKVGVKAKGPYKLEFALTSGATYFPQLLALFNVMPIRDDLIKKHKDQWMKPKNLVTLGPYLLKSWQHEKAIHLVRNENYYGGPASARNIVFRILKEKVTALNLFDAGELDAVNGLPAADLVKLSQRPEYKQVQDLAIEYLSFNTRVAPFNKPQFRAALAASIDRNQIVELLRGGIRGNSSLLPHGILGHSSEVGIRHDKDFARKKMIRAFGKIPVPSLTLSYYTDATQKRLAENLQAQIKSSLNLSIELHHMEWKSYLGKINSTPPGLFRIGWMAIYPDPNLFMSLFTTDSHFNTTGWSSAKYDKLVKEAQQVSDPQKRKEKYVEAQKILLEKDVVAIPLYTGARQYLVSSRVKNYPLNPQNRLIFKNVQLTK